MRSLYCSIILIFGLGSSSWAKDYSLKKSIYNNSEVKFKVHRGGGRYSSYLAMNINYAPVKELYNDFIKDQSLKLKNRGEAHITVITPVEYGDRLAGFMTIDEINKIAGEFSIQDSKFQVKCLGEGKSRKDKTYYIVVVSDDLLEIRKRIEQLYLERGGDSKKFQSSHYFPHITLGYTKRDLHESDGVIKDEKSCIHTLLME